jgi:RND family efflux transporter MFP subunit
MKKHSFINSNGSTIKRVALVFALLTLSLAGLSSCSSEKKETAAAPETVRDVALYSVQRTTVPDVVEAVGTVHATETAQLSAQVMGNVVAMNAHEGDHVRRGQVLIVIDDAQARAGVDRAQAAVSASDHEAAAAQADSTLADATMKRYQNLFEKKSVSPQEFDEIKARFQAASARREMARSGQAQAKAALAEAQTMLGYSRIRAPFDGVVTEKRVDPGTLAAPGMPLMTIEATGRYRLEATVDESSIQYVKFGEPVSVSVEALGGRDMKGKVVQIVPAADPASRSFTVKVELPADPNLRSGLFGRAMFPKGERNSIVVPRTAVIERGQLQGVYVLGPDRIANMRYVTLGKNAGDQQVEVLSGLQPGESMVTNPGERDLTGKRIEGVRQ